MKDDNMIDSDTIMVTISEEDSEDDKVSEVIFSEVYSTSRDKCLGLNPPINDAPDSLVDFIKTHKGTFEIMIDHLKEVV